MDLAEHGLSNNGLQFRILMSSYNSSMESGSAIRFFYLVPFGIGHFLSLAVQIIHGLVEFFIGSFLRPITGVFFNTIHISMTKLVCSKSV